MVGQEPSLPSTSWSLVVVGDQLVTAVAAVRAVIVRLLLANHLEAVRLLSLL